MRKDLKKEWENFLRIKDWRDGEEKRRGGVISELIRKGGGRLEDREMGKNFEFQIQ